MAIWRRGQLTKHFNVSEFKCGDGTGYIAGMRKLGLSKREAKARAVQLAKYLEEVRARCGNKPLHLNSVYRTPSYNRLIGGASNSAHIRGLAADIARPKGVRQEELRRHVRAVFPAGVGNYPSQNFVHGDFDSNLGRRDWEG